jgi:heptosyltransferase-2
MPASTEFENIRKLLVVVPNWVGDAAMASPTLAALRRHFAHTEITFLMRPYVGEVVAGGGWHDGELHWSTQRGLRGEGENLRLARRIAAQRFDAAILLTNSFRSAATVRLAGVPRRVGYARDGRGWLLTHRLRPLRDAEGRFVPSPVVDSYAALAERVGCAVADRELRLGVTQDQERQAAELKRHYGIDDGKAYAVINPGAAFGDAKCWLPERFAEVCDRLVQERGLRPVIVGAPGERALMQSISDQARSQPILCNDPGTTLGSLKPLIRDAALLVCNDTGPRHYGIAFGVPTLSIFGPTHQAWALSHAPRETRLQVAVECGPCQLRACPIDHRCMTRVTSDMVMTGIADLISGQGGAPRDREPAAPATS